MDAGHSATKSKKVHNRQTGGLKELKGHYEHYAPLSPANLCLLLSFLLQFPQNLLTYKNGIGQTSKLEGIKYQLTQKALEANPTAAWLLRFSCFLVW